VNKRLLLLTALFSSLTSLLAAFATDLWLTQPYLWNNIGLQKAYNLGIAFSINLGVVQTPIIIAALILLTYVALQHSAHILEHIGYGCIIGGGLANIVDRLLDGKVTDMFRVGNFPIFNVADISINLGVGLLLLHLVLHKKNS
jgi:signal peptidase II